jgi:threonine aldolase
MAALVAVARKHGLPIHLDGARLWNAAAALGVPVAELAAGFDSVMFSLSKGLGAPVGSMLCAAKDFIHEARRVRKMFGGGMRQVGVLAAAGRVALARGPENLDADHENARWLAEELAAMPGIDLDPATVETNIVIFRVAGEGGAHRFVERAAERGVLAVPISADAVRLVTHRDVPRRKVERAAAVFREM